VRHDDWYLMFTWINIVLFLVAAVTASVASIGAAKEILVIKRIKSVVAGTYFFGLLWSVTLGSQSKWAPIAQGLGCLTIPLVFILPDLIGLRYHTRTAQFAEDRLTELKTKLERENGETCKTSLRLPGQLDLGES